MSAGRRLTPVLLSVAAIAVLAWSGCAASAPPEPTAAPILESAMRTTARPPAPTTTPEAPMTTGAPMDSTTTITLEFDGIAVTCFLTPSATTMSLIEQLPLDLTFTDAHGQEKLAPVPMPLSLDGAPSSSDASAGMVGYYAPAQVLVLYYDTVGRFPGIVPIGTFDDVALVRDRGPFTATVR